MPQIDPAFTDLAPERLADAALGNARQLGAEHADFRLERIRVGTLRLRDGQLDTTADTEDLGLAVRVVHDGAWGFASGIARTPEAAATLAEQAVATAQVSRVLSSDPVELAAEPVYAGRRGSRPTTSIRSTSRRTSASAGWPSCPSGCCPPMASITSTRTSCTCWRTSSTPIPPARSTTQQRVRMQARVHRRARRPRRRHVLLHAHAGPAGRARLGVPDRHRLGLRREIAELPGLLARARQGAERRGRRATTW